ncbi:MAG: secretion system protein, partial [Methanoregula sp.]
MNVRHSLQKWLLRDPIRYHGIHADLVSSRSGLTLEQYLWKSIRISIVSGILFAILGYMVSEFFAQEVRSGKGVYNVLNLQLPGSLTLLSSPTVVVSA